MTNHERMLELLDAAAKLNALLVEHNKMVRPLVSALISSADELKLAASDEKSAGAQVTKKIVTYGEKGAETGRIDVTQPNVTAPPNPMKLLPGKRACSLCRQPGHRAQNCPNAHVVQAAKKQKAEAREKRRARR